MTPHAPLPGPPEPPESQEPPGLRVLPDLAEVLGTLRVVALPLRVPFRGIEVREAALVQGPAGWGEFAPFLEYEPPEASRWLAAALDSAWSPWPKARRATVAVNATVPAVRPDQVPGVLARFPGCTTVKVKVAEPGGSLGEDVARVAAVREAIGPAGLIRVDANGAWSVGEAREALGELAAYGLDYAEQPCPDVSALAALRAALARDGIPVLVAADESVRKAEDPLRVAREGAADVLVVKAAPLGGVRAALAVVEAAGLPVVVSSALDTSVGIAAGVALAAALPSLHGACGLGTVGLLAGDVAREPLLAVGGELPVGRIAPDPGLLERYAAPPNRVAWWRDRVAACHAVLDREGEDHGGL